MLLDDLFASISHRLHAHAPHAEKNGSEITKRLKELLDLTTRNGPDAPPSTSRKGDDSEPLPGTDKQNT